MSSESEPVSLEFIEDSYLPRIDDITTTPSLDELELCPTSDAIYWCDETDQYLRNLTLDDIFYDVDNDYANTLELQAVETEFIAAKLANQTPSMSIAKRFRLKFFAKRSMRDVKVTFIDFSKPYLAKISNSENYKRFLTIGHGAKDNTGNLTEPTSPAASVASAEIAAEFAALTVEEKEQRRAEWSQELARVEEEINTLRTVLASKTRHASDLKRKLGITVWKELTDDVNQGVKNLKESHVFQRTESVLKTTGEKTASVFSTITGGITSKLSQMKNSDSMRSIEASVGSAYENVKTKVTSRSGSVSSFPDALDENNTSSGMNSPTDSLTK
ncbi:tumor protein D52 isoform X5 [Drosophila busckii]|uniref:tumor protein D52 isoform X5 n=1 Tax=Drosophila busckii TaxID=30019 RepID=UPI0014328956|nr:tumor protein D52 isoform X5 [Drosophila busckii]